MTPETSQELESFLPVYDTVPESWEEGRQFLIEQLKKISEAVNVREIGWFMDQELLSGKILFPTANTAGQQQENRQLLRTVIDGGALGAVANVIPHSIVFDSNFTLVDLWVAATNSVTLMAQVITGDSVIMDAANITVTSTAAYDRSIIVVEYTQEL